LNRFKNQNGRHCAAGPVCQRHAASPSRTQLLPTGPRCRSAPLVSRRNRVARAPLPSTVARQCRCPRPPVEGRCQPPEPSPTVPGPPPPSFFPIPALHAAPTLGPLASLFPLCRAPECVQKAPVVVLLSSPLRSFSPTLKHAATSPVLPRIGPSA
jgi:hypothetical protein